MLLPCAVTTGFRIWALLPGLDSPFFVESAPFYLLRCSRLYEPTLCHRLHGLRLPPVRPPL